MKLTWILRPPALFLGLLACILVRLIAPFKRIRVGLLNYNRIGHLCSNTEIFLRARALGKEDPDAFYFFFSSTPANRQILSMIKRRVAVLCFPHADKLYIRGFKPFFEGTPFAIGLKRHSYEFDEFARARPQLSFLPEEEERGRELLRSLGIPDGAPFACFHSRDGKYLSSELPGNDWSYHDYRDCAIENYLPAARALASRGLYMIRMGHHVEKLMPEDYPRIIDYAGGKRSDFGDIFLLARCKFLLGSTSGLACVPLSFDVPVAMANLVPIGRPLWHRHDLFIPKRLRDRKTGRFLSFREIVESGAFDWLSGKKYAAAGIEAVENSAEEISALAYEMNARLDGAWTPAQEDEALQRRFWALLPSDHPARGCPSRVGAAFLRLHQDALQ